MSESKRIQFEFPPEAVERLDRMKTISGVNSDADVIRHALRVFEWVIDSSRKGYDIALLKDNEVIKQVYFLI